MPAPEAYDNDKGQAAPSVSRWVEPRLTRLSAGSAEVGPAPRNDTNGEFS